MLRRSLLPVFGLLCGAWTHGSGSTGTGPPTINSIALSNNTVTAGSPNGTAIGTASATMSSGSFTGTWSLATTGDICNSTNGANNSTFSINSGTGAITTAGTIAQQSYAVCILATQAGASNSPKGLAATITGTAAAASTAVTCGPTNAYSLYSVVPSGATVCAVSVTPGSWVGTVSLGSQSGVNAGKFALTGACTGPANCSVTTNTSLTTSNPGGDLTTMTITTTP